MKFWILMFHIWLSDLDIFDYRFGFYASKSPRNRLETSGNWKLNQKLAKMRFWFFWKVWILIFSGYLSKLRILACLGRSGRQFPFIWCYSGRNPLAGTWKTTKICWSKSLIRNFRRIYLFFPSIFDQLSGIQTSESVSGEISTRRIRICSQTCPNLRARRKQLEFKISKFSENAFM